MSTTTKSKAPAKTSPSTRSIDHLQDAIRDLDKARERAGAELRESLDAGIERLRDVMGDLRERAEHQASEFERMFDETTEDGRRELGRRAIMAQRSDAALKEMSATVRKRRSELSGGDAVG
jgi:uncharacterized protein YicC (UPF0701 family)